MRSSNASPFLVRKSLILSYHVLADLGYLWEEPYAGKPHVRICEGESRMAELLDHARMLPPETDAMSVTSRSAPASRKNRTTPRWKSVARKPPPEKASPSFAMGRVLCIEKRFRSYDKYNLRSQL